MSATERFLKAIINGNASEMNVSIFRPPMFGIYPHVEGYRFVASEIDFTYVETKMHCQFDRKIGGDLFLSLALTLCMNQLTFDRVAVFFKLLEAYRQSNSPAYFESVLTFYQHLKAQPQQSPGFLFERSAITQSTLLVKGWMQAVEKIILEEPLAPAAMDAFRAHCFNNHVSFDEIIAVLRQHLPCLDEAKNPDFYTDMRTQFLWSSSSAGHRTWVSMLMFSHLFNHADAKLAIASSHLHKMFVDCRTVAPFQGLTQELLYAYFLSVFDARNEVQAVYARLAMLRDLKFNVTPYVGYLVGRVKEEKPDENIVLGIEQIFNVRLRLMSPRVAAPIEVPISAPVVKSPPKKTPPVVKLEQPTYVYQIDDVTTMLSKKLEGSNQAIAAQLIAAIERDDDKGLQDWLNPALTLNQEVVEVVLNHLKSRRPYFTTDRAVLGYFARQHFNGSFEVMARLNALLALVCFEREGFDENIVINAKVDVYANDILGYLSDSPYYCLAAALFFEKKWVTKSELVSLLNKKLCDQHLPKSSVLFLQKQLGTICLLPDGSALIESAQHDQPEDEKKTAVWYVVDRVRQAMMGESATERGVFKRAVLDAVRIFHGWVPSGGCREINVEHVVYIHQLLSKKSLSNDVRRCLLTEKERESGWLYATYLHSLKKAHYSKICDSLSCFFDGDLGSMFAYLTRPTQKESIFPVFHEARHPRLALNNDLMMAVLRSRNLSIDLNDSAVLTVMIALLFLLKKCASTNDLKYNDRMSDEALFIHWFINAPSVVSYRFNGKLNQCMLSTGAVALPKMLEEARFFKNDLKKAEKNAGNLDVVAGSVLAQYGESALLALHQKLLLEGPFSCLLLNLLMFDEATNTLKETEVVKKVREQLKALSMPMETWRVLKSRVCEPNVVPSPRDAVLVLAFAGKVCDAIDAEAIIRHHLLDYIFPEENKALRQAELIEALKLLDDEALTNLKNSLSNMLLSEKPDVDIQGLVKNLIINNKVNDSPLLFILRAGRSKYEIKDTKHYVRVRSVLAPEASRSFRAVNLFTSVIKRSSDEAKVNKTKRSMEYNSVLNNL